MAWALPIDDEAVMVQLPPRGDSAYLARRIGRDCVRPMPAADRGRRLDCLHIGRSPPAPSIPSLRAPRPVRTPLDPRPLFETLVHSIVGRDLAVADAIWNRLVTLVGPIEPDAFNAVTDTDLRAVGLSGRKVEYIRGVTAAAPRLAATAWADLSDGEIHKTLCALRGIGPWSADILLIFCFLRPDVLPLGDIGVVRVMERLYGEGRSLTPAALRDIGACWAPYRPWRPGVSGAASTQSPSSIELTGICPRPSTTPGPPLAGRRRPCAKHSPHPRARPYAPAGSGSNRCARGAFPFRPGLLGYTAKVGARRSGEHEC